MYRLCMIPCKDCGAPAEERSAAQDGEVFASAFQCDRCWQRDLSGFRAAQAEFQELIDAGVDRKAANEIMIDRIEGRRAS